MIVKYDVIFARSARKELETLDEKLSSRILRKIESLYDNPRSPGCEKLKGVENLWRIRVGDYRIVYSINDKEKLVDVVVIRHRRDVYR